MFFHLRLEEINLYQTQGAFIRNRAKYKLEGDKPTQLFGSLEKNNGVKRYVPQLFIQRNNSKVLIDDQKEVEKEIYLHRLPRLILRTRSHRLHA